MHHKTCDDTMCGGCVDDPPKLRTSIVDRENDPAIARLREVRDRVYWRVARASIHRMLTDGQSHLDDDLKAARFALALSDGVYLHAVSFFEARAVARIYFGCATSDLDLERTNIGSIVPAVLLTSEPNGGIEGRVLGAERCMSEQLLLLLPS
jgi:hypothetical protein